MTSLHIDSNRKTIRLELELKGESSPIVVEVENYDLLQQDDGTFLRLNRISASREWITLLLREWVPKQQIKLPRPLSMVL